MGTEENETDELGVFEDFEPVDMGEGNAAEDHDEYAAGYDAGD